MSAFPSVARDDESAAFFDAAARGELLVVRGGPEPFVARGTGRLVTWAVVHRAPIPALADAVPYVTAMVELDEGPWLSVRLIDADPATLRAGDPVRVAYVRSGDGDQPGEVLPVFRPGS